MALGVRMREHGGGLSSRGRGIPKHAILISGLTEVISELGRAVAWRGAKHRLDGDTGGTMGLRAAMDRHAAQHDFAQNGMPERVATFCLRQDPSLTGAVERGGERSPRRSHIDCNAA